MRKWTVGIDFGGTAIKAGLVSAAGRVVHTQALASKTAARPAAFLDGVAEVVESLTRTVGIRPSALRGLGVGAPGPVDTDRGLVYTLVNVPGWRQVPLQRELERRLRCPCAVDNDVNLFTLGEWRFGAGRGARSLVGLTLGTGVGGGLMFEGALYRGVSGAAGEAGHMVIDPRGPRCGCGGRGCLEAHIGTRAILRMGRVAMRHGAQPLRRLARDARDGLTPELISRAAQRGDAKATAIWREVGGHLGLGVVNLVNLLNPDRIVIGGGVVNAWRFFSASMLEMVRARAMAVSAGSVRIVRSRLGHRAGILGAAALIWQRHSASRNV